MRINLINFGRDFNKKEKKHDKNASVISKHFYDGKTLSVQFSDKSYNEYEVPVSRSDFNEDLNNYSLTSSLIEYEIPESRSEFAEEQNGYSTGTSLVEYEIPGLTEEPSVENSSFPENKSGILNPEMSAPIEKFEQNNEIKEYENLLKDKLEEISEDKVVNNNKELKNNKADKEDENDLLNDIKSILKGKKTYDSDKKEVVEKTDSKIDENEKKQLNEINDINKIQFKESEHKIFEKIAQNMAYANAYDLGDIKIKNLFNELDKQIVDEKPKQNIAKTSSKFEDYKATTNDFINDIDRIVKDKNAAAESLSDKGTQSDVKKDDTIVDSEINIP